MIFLSMDRPEHRGTDRLKERGLDIVTGLQLSRAEMLRGLGVFLNTDRPEHHSTDRLKERGVEKGNSPRSTLRGPPLVRVVLPAGLIEVTFQTA